jgi:hypothetical protein
MLANFVHMKKKTVIRVVVVLILLAIAVRISWVLMLSPTAHQSATSPDKRYVADISSRWRDDFWFGAAHDRHDIRIASYDGRSVRHLVMDDRSIGWPQECAIQWADDSSSVTFAFKREEMDSARVIIPVRP